MKLKCIKVISRNEKVNIELNDEIRNKTLLQLFCDQCIYISNPCNGNGSCGKCRVLILQGKSPVSDADRRLLTADEIKFGMRLACKVKVNELSGLNEEDYVVIKVVEESEENILVKTIKAEQGKLSEGGNCFIVIDIGTTTIAMVLVDAKTGEVRDTYVSLNHQRLYGADVISRIKASNEGKSKELKGLIEKDLWSGIGKLIKKDHKSYGENKEKNNSEKCDITISKIIIAGNTTMIHLLMGYSCESLGKHPFITKHLKQIDCSLSECISISAKENDLKEESFPLPANVPVTILPGISAFVGGDIVADIIACDGFLTEDICLLVDLGTNGEMVLGNKDRFLTTSTAAGPAFEGGNIACGTASIPGSISQVKIQNQRAIVKTIQSVLPPVGICGTGLVSAIAELRNNRIIDQEGVLKVPYFNQGYPLWVNENGEKISLYQKDIREFQMAKAAIRAGIEILMEEYGCIKEDVKRVYIAGGFGSYLRKEDALNIGLLPMEFADKIESIGNGVLLGAIRLEMEGKENSGIDNVLGNKYEAINNAKHIYLSEKTAFQEKYIEQLNFS